MMFDTHMHLDGKQAGTAEKIFYAAIAEGISRFLVVGGSEEANRKAVEAACDFPGHVRAAVGFDREQARLMDSAGRIDDGLALLDIEIKNPGKRCRIAAVGEIGLDFHYSSDIKKQQEVLFKRQLEFAANSGLPVSVHSRDAECETLEILGEYSARLGGGDRAGVLHCFTGSADFAAKILQMGFYISFSGIITFPGTERLREVAGLVPDSRILAETDAPYLAPVPCRGRINQPAFVRYVVAKLAEIRGCSFEAMAQLTADNAARLFGM